MRWWGLSNTTLCKRICLNLFFELTGGGDAKTMDVSACAIAGARATWWNFHNLIFTIFYPLDIEPYATKSRKSLDFSTPSCRRKGRNLDESIYTPLESPASDNNKQSNKFNGLRNEPRKASKNNNNLNKRKGKSINRLRCPV